MCGSPLSNIWHVFFFKKTSDEQLIIKAIILQNQSAIFKAQIKRQTQNESVTIAGCALFILGVRVNMIKRLALVLSGFPLLFQRCQPF